MRSQQAGTFGRLPDKPAVSGERKAEKGKTGIGEAYFSIKHLILGMTALAIFLPLFGLTGMVYKYTCLKAEYQGCCVVRMLCTAEAAEKTIKYAKSAKKDKGEELSVWTEGVGKIPFQVRYWRTGIISW